MIHPSIQLDGNERITVRTNPGRGTKEIVVTNEHCDCSFVMRLTRTQLSDLFNEIYREDWSQD